jgi:P-type Cu2+ transporter
MMVASVDLSHFVRLRDGGVGEIELALESLDGKPEMDLVEGAIRDLPGVLWARFNLERLRVTVRWASAELEPSSVVEALARIGYRAHPLDAGLPDDELRRHVRWLLSCLAVAGFAAMNIMLLSVSVWAGNVTDITPETRDFFHWLAALIALPAAAFAGQPFFRSAIAALHARSLNMDVPISLGVLLALGMSVVETARHAEHAYFDSAVMLLFFLLCGRYLDLAMRLRTRAVVGNLAALKVDVAQRVGADGEVATVPVAAVRPGDRVLVRPGERFSVDGVISHGTSEIDDSLVTGETDRRQVGPGDRVHCGSSNFNGAVTVHVTAAGDDTLLAEVERLLHRATDQRSRYLRLADRAARLYSPVVHLTAALTLAGWLIAGASLHDAAIIAISVLIITCPCALALAVPAVQVVASGALFRRGVLLNSADAIERLAQVDVVVFDKTGTLTLPEPRIANAADIDPVVRRLAGRLALSSHHPLARVLAAEAAQDRPLPDAREEPGQGVRAIVDGREARLGSASFCGFEGRQSGDKGTSVIAFSHGPTRALFHVRQGLRADASRTIDSLRREGYPLSILSGDHAAAVATVAASLGIRDWLAAQRPADKIGWIEAAASAGRRVLMVGDGLNDAPALAAAHASIAPISASHLAQAKADAVFMSERLAPIADTLATARIARRLMRQNLMLAIVYNAIAVPLAVAGFVTPLIAAAAMSGSSVLVTLNAMRARGRSRGPTGEPKTESSDRGGASE